MANDTNINMSDELTQNMVVHKNFSTEFVVIDVASLKNILRDYYDDVKKTSDWIGVLALVVSLVLANCTTTFQPAFGLTSDTWKAIFVICLIASIIWIVVVVIRLFKTKKRRNLEYLLKIIKAESQNTSEQ